MERAGSMKKTLTIVCALFVASLPSCAENYQYVQNSEDLMFQTYNTAKKETKDVLQNKETNTSAEEEENEEKIIDVNDIFVPDKTLKQKYKVITTSAKLIEAVELLKDNAGAFAYRSIHGNNKTCSPIKIYFKNMEGDKQDTDAYGEFKKNKYEICINSKYAKSPAGAIAPLLAREGLVSKEKTDEDKETAKKLQIAVWTQLCEKISGLESKNDPLIRTQNMLKSGASLDDYAVFLKKERERKKTHSKQKKEDNYPPPPRKQKGHATQTDFDAENEAESEKAATDILYFDSKSFEKTYKRITKEDRIIEALELLKNTVGKFSYEAILKNNLTHRPMVIKFKNLSDINPQYASFDALGWKQGGKYTLIQNT